MFVRSLAVAAALLGGTSLSAQFTRLTFGAAPTNLRADLAQVIVSPAAAPGELYLLAPFGGQPAQRFPFTMFWWNAHPWMDYQFPGGWWEVRFSFVQWAYLSAGPCGLQPAPGAVVPHGGIDSLYDYGPPLFTGPALGVNTPLPGWVLGDAAVPRVAGLPFLTTIEETFALFLEDYWHTPLNACTTGTPVEWVAVHVRLDLVQH